MEENPDRKKKGLFLKIIKRSLYAFLGLFLFIFIFAFIVIRSEHAKQYAIKFFAEEIKAKTGLHANIGSLNFTPPFHWILKDINILQDQQSFLKINHLEVDISLKDLWNKNIYFHSIVIDGVTFLPPQKSENQNFIDLSQLWDIIPTFIKIDDLQVHRFMLKEIPLSFQGNLSFNPKAKHADAHLNVYLAHLFDQEAQTHLSLTCVLNKSDFDFQFKLKEDLEGIFARQLAPFNLFESEISVKASGTSQGLAKIVSGRIGSETDLIKGSFEAKAYRKKDPPKDFAWIGDRGSLRGNFIYSTDRLLKIDSLIVESEPLEIKGHILLNPRLNIDGTFFECILKNHEFLNKFADNSSQSKISTDISFSGNLFSPHMSLKILCDKIASGNVDLENFIANIDLQYDEKKLKGKGNFDLQILKHPFSSSIDFLLEEDSKINVSNLKAQFLDIEFLGNLTAALPEGIIEGEVEGKTEDLSTPFKLADKKARGAALIKAKFFSHHNQQSIDFSGTAKKMFIEGKHADEVLIAGLIHDLFQDPKGNIKISIQDALFDTVKLSKILVETDFDFKEDHWPFHLECNGKDKFALNFESKGVWRSSAASFLLTLESFEGKFSKYPLKLQEPVNLAVIKESVELSPVFFTMGEGSLYSTLDFSPTSVHTTTRLRNIPLEAFFGRSASLPLAGSMNADAFLYGSPSKLLGQIQFKLSNVKVLEEAFAKLPGLQASFVVNLLDNAIESNAKISGVAETPIELDAQLPVTISLTPPSINVDHEKQLSSHIVANGEIAPLLQLFLTDTTILSGKTSVEVDITGTAEAPQIVGKASIDQGSFESPEFGSIFKNVQAKIEAAGKHLVLKEFTAADEKGGTVVGAGSMDLDFQKQFPFEISLQFVNARLLRLDYAKATASGNVVLKGNFKEGLIEGNIASQSAQITIPEHASSSIESVDITYVNFPRGEISPIFYSKKESKWPLKLNLKLEVPGNLAIKGRDLTSRWKGDILINGTSENPLLYGDVKIIDGEYRFNGKAFQINQGTISLAGDPEKKTTLYVIASKDLGKLIAEVIVKGSIKNPSLAFRSNPPLSQREIVSWILFNRGISEITPFQGAELNQSITNLKTDNEGPDVLTKFRDKIGLDRIDISRSENSESNAVSLQVGKYISRGVFVTLNKSMSAEGNRVGIEANVMHNIKVEAEVSDEDDGCGNIQLKWKHDY